MKIQFCSDLHLERRPDYTLAKTDADVIVLAGDIDVGIKAVEFAIQEAERQHKPIIIVAGNHEFYHHDHTTLLREMKEKTDNYPLVHFLENNEVMINGVRFLGCTLWTDYKGNGSISAEKSMRYIGHLLTDHIVIRHGEQFFSTMDALTAHKSSRAWLERTLAQPYEGKTVVVTHHGPSVATQHKYYTYSIVSSAFLSDMDAVVELADCWIYGHSHSNLDVMIGGCRLVSNQLGYPHEEVNDYHDKWVITV